MLAGMSSQARPTLGRYIFASIRRNLVPGIALWCVGTMVVVSYYFWPAAREALGVVGELKSRYGLGFSMVSTAVFAGVIPLGFLAVTGQLREDAWYRRSPWRRTLSLLVFGVLFWAYKGAEVDLLYRGQTWLWGEGTGWRVVLPKVLVDQFVYVVLWASWSQTLAYLWKDRGFRLAATWASAGREFWLFTVVATTVTNWLIWVPAVVCVYVMPSALQLPMQNLVLCFYVLLLNFLARGRVPLLPLDPEAAGAGGDGPGSDRFDSARRAAAG